ncbi:MAG: RagB/SusD family nutrient uptake outer membrane protein [Muribaculaceae bacterium]|nr:RagB/SusD family nutrient uptake outer membrane protein [Muribaculaceae bacterium]
MTAAIAATALTSCSDELDNIKPRHAILQGELNDADMGKLLTGLYATMESYVWGQWWIDDLQGENFKGGPAGGNIVDPCNMAPSYSTDQVVNVLSVWRNGFSAINQINFMMDAYEKSTNKESDLMKRVGLSVHYFRALTYYHLAKRYGNLPIMRTVSNTIIPLSSENEVWAFIEEDLAKAMSINATATSKWYVSPDAVKALAARVALFRGKNADAARYADDVISNTAYSLCGSSMDFSSIFISGSSSQEIIFAFVNNTRTSGFINFANSCNDTDGSWNYAPADDRFALLYSDDKATSRGGDIRRAATFQADDPTRVIKYSNGANQLAPCPDYLHLPVMVSRISEMYLIKAEALGKSAGASTMVTFLKKRYATCPTETALQTMSDRAWQDLILDERHREFYAEGMRWSDIKRTGRTDLLKELNGRTYLMYWPIPQAEIDIAGTEAYPQNPGYAGYKGN